MKCIVCKQPIAEGQVQHTEQGPVHVGACAQYLAEQTLNESTGVVADTELLM